MNKRLILLLPLIITSLVSCQKHEHDYELVISKDNGWHTFIAGKEFDKDGIEVSLRCKGCHDHKVVDYSVIDGDELELEQTSVTFKYEDYSLEYNIKVKEKYHIACVGDSLTAGHYWPNQSYPSYLANTVSEDYAISNCGENGISITGYGGNSIKYVERPVYQQSIDFAPDIFAIMLGTNDATGWANAEPLFVDDYHALLDSYLELFPNARFIMMVSPPTTTPNSFNIPNDVIKEEVNPIQRELAEEYEFETLDLREEFEAVTDYESKYLRPNDGVHFSEEAAQYVANRVWDIAKDLRF